MVSTRIVELVGGPADGKLLPVRAGSLTVFVMAGDPMADFYETEAKAGVNVPPKVGRAVYARRLGCRSKYDFEGYQ